jgi:hypothetical protein
MLESQDGANDVRELIAIKHFEQVLGRFIKHHTAF